MRQIYIGWNITTIVLLTLFIIYASKRNGALAKNTLLICLYIAICSLFYTLCLFITNTKIVSTLYAVYCALHILILYEVLNFVVNFTQISIQQQKTSIHKYIFLSLFAIDAISFFVNIFTNHIFILTPILFEDGSLHHWKIQILAPYYYHIVLNSFMAIQNIISLTKRIFRVPEFYRKKYMTLLFLFLVITIVSAIEEKMKHGFDYSLCLYVFIASYGFYLAFFGMSKSLLDTMLSLVSENIKYGVACFDEKEKCFYLNRNACTVFGYEKSGIASAEGYMNKLKILYPQNMNDYLHIEQDLPIDGNPHKYISEYKVVRDKKNKPIVSYLKLEDTTEQLQRLEQEKHRTEHDPLTGLYNRKAFFEYASQMLKTNLDDRFYLIATNLMDFKVVNGLFGEEVGNEILKVLAQKLTTFMFPKEVVGRISGDKFAVLLPKIYFDKNELTKLNDELQQAVQKYNFKLQNYVGIYEISDHYENVNSMFDKAMLTIKTIRGNFEKTIAFYDMPLMEKMLRDKRIISEFDNALANNEFIMYLHPQVNAKTSKVMGAEALVRWITHSGEIIPPGEFLPILERSGMIHKLDQYIWEQAAKKLAQWKETGNNMYISINISPKDFYYCDICAFLTNLVEKYKINPKKLNVEITETVLMQNVDADRSILQKLHEYGFTIEMDDFGSGYSSLNTLKNLEMDVLKIDMAFLKDGNLNKKSRDIISSIVTMAKALGMTVVSEGVETEEQTTFLREIGCDIFQGYYFSKPLPIEDFENQYGGKNE